MQRTLWKISVLLVVLAGGVAGAGELLIDDFADGDLESPLGLLWMVIGDDLMGGTSAASLTVKSVGEGHSLVLDGRMGVPAGTPEGLPVAFVGAWTAVGGDGLARDLSAYRGLRLRAKAITGSFQVGIRRAGVSTNFTAPVALGSEWTEVEVPFSTLKPLGGDTAAEWSATDVTWVGISSSGKEAVPVRVEIARLVFYGGPDAQEAPASAAAAGSPVVRAHLVDVEALPALGWTVVAEEAAGDALRARLPDARTLAWAAGPDGRIWFRVTLADAPPERWLGINVALDTDKDPENGMAWWGTNAGFHFDLLVTAYLTRVEGAWLGTLGVAGAEDIAQGVMDGVTGDAVAAVDRENSAFLVGVPSEALPAGVPARVIATVGSSMVNNDDLPNDGAVTVSFPRAKEP